MATHTLDKRKSQVHWGVAIIIVIQLGVNTAVEFVPNTYVDYYGTIWTLYIVAALPVLGYTLIYIGIRNHYKNVIN